MASHLCLYPPGYDSNTGTRFPVLYLQHGAGEDERVCTEQGRANFILDNLIADEKTKPMILVMECGTISEPRGGGGGHGTPKGGIFGQLMITELIPMIDSSYRTYVDKDHRAMAGLSMGGGQTAAITTANLDKFSYIGLFSGGVSTGFGAGPATPPAPNLKTIYNGAMADPPEFNRKVKVFFFSCGSVENPTALLRHQRQLVAAGISNSCVYISPGTAHEWQTWRRSLYCFTPLLFRN